MFAQSGNAVLACLLSASESRAGLVDGVIDPLAALDGLDQAASTGWYHDAPRKNIHPTRSLSMSVAYWPFNDLTGWTNISGNGSSATISNPGSADPAIGNVLDLQTNANLGAVAGVQRAQSAIPASFGYMVIVNLAAVGSNPTDALHINIQNSENVVLSVRYYDGHVDVFQDGAWRLLMAHGGAYDTEWWVELIKESDGTHTVLLLAGTAVVGERRGYMPGGAPGNTNLVWFQQFSGATANRRSKIAILQIGASQLPDSMTLIGKSWPASLSPTRGHFLALVENISEDLAANQNLVASLSNDDGQTWEEVALVNRGHHGAGVIDPPKSVRILTGSAGFCPGGQAMRWKIATEAGSFLPIRGIGMTWE